MAVNTAAVLSAKPRYVVLPDHLAAFEQRRAAHTPPKPRRRPRQTGVINYYPGDEGTENPGRDS
jgi:hypothetical protein